MTARTLLPALLAAVLLTVTGCGANGAADTTGAEEPAQDGPASSRSAAENGTAADESSGSERSEASEGTPPLLRFTATTVDGASFDAASLAGKPTVLWFWAPWCPTCRGQAEQTAEVAAEFAGRAHVVGVAGLDDTAAMRDFVDSTGTDGFPQLTDEPGTVWQRFRVTQQSTYVLLDANGERVYSGVLPGGEGLAGKVARLVG